MQVAFTKTGKKQNWVHVTRADGTKESFHWPAHPGLPHDAIHLIVERGFFLHHGFWGLFFAGVNLTTLNNAVEQAHTGVKVKDLAGRDATELYQAEALAACFSNEMLWAGTKPDGERREAVNECCTKWGVPVPETFNPGSANEVAHELSYLLMQWNQLKAGDALTLHWRES